MNVGGMFLATFFIVPQALPYDQPFRQPPRGEIQTFGWRDSPTTTGRHDISFALEGLPWELQYLGKWDHPRGQQIAKLKAL